MNSPRSIEACRQLGIIPSELYFQDFETFIKLNPEMISLPKDIQKIRFENIDNYRKETIKMVIDQREKIINNQKQKEKQKEKINESLENNNNNITPSKMNTNMYTNSFNEHYGTTNNEEKPIPVYNLDEQLNTMIEKEKKKFRKIKKETKERNRG